MLNITYVRENIVRLEMIIKIKLNIKVLTCLNIMN